MSMSSARASLSRLHPGELVEVSLIGGQRRRAALFEREDKADWRLSEAKKGVDVCSRIMHGTGAFAARPEKAVGTRPLR